MPMGKGGRPDASLSSQCVQGLLNWIKDHEKNTTRLQVLKNKVEELNLEFEETRDESIWLTTRVQVCGPRSWMRGQTIRPREDLDAKRKQHQFELATIKRDLLNARSGLRIFF